MAGKPRGNAVTDEQILSSYEVTRSAHKTAAELGLGSTTVYRVLTKNGVQMNGLAEFRQNSGRYRGREHEIRRDYEAGATYEALIKKFGEGSIWSVKAAIKKAGGTLRENPAPLVKDGELDRIREMNAQGVGQVAISLELGRSQSFVSRLMRAHGISTNQRSGPKHSQWKGGRIVDGAGYVRVLVAKDDPLVARRMHDGYVLEHRLVMARKLGRPLSRSETVHHINGDKADNRPENLELRQGKHGKHVVICCLECGSRNVGPVSLS